MVQMRNDSLCKRQAAKRYTGVKITTKVKSI